MILLQLLHAVGNVAVASLEKSLHSDVGLGAAKDDNTSQLR